MLPLIAALIPFVLPPQASSLRLYSIPTSQEVSVATMAARDEGYDPANDGTFLDELHNSDGQPPHPGYKTIALYSSGQLIHAYSIRIQTGDVADARTCQLFAYPDLLKFKRKLMTSFGTDPVPSTQIAGELGCPKLDVLRTPQKLRK